MNELNPINRMMEVLREDMRSREESLDELKECTKQLQTLNQRLGVLMGGLIVFGSSQLGIGIVQNNSIEKLPDEIPQVQLKPATPKRSQP
jgi:hypothetical protein